MRQHPTGARAVSATLPRTVLAVVALIGCAVMLMAGSSAPAGAAGIVPPDNPAINIPPQVMPACSITPVDDDSSGCIDSVLHNINYGRYLEGLGPLVLPSGFASDPVPVQQLIITDEERGDRGLSEFTGIDPVLNAAALTAAQDNKDPAPPNGFDYSSAGSIFALDYTPLGADYAWMYNDGYGGTNIGCTSPSDRDCWGHRDNILGPWVTVGSQTADMGDANTTNGQYTEIFANEEGTPDSLIDTLTPSSLPTPSTPAAPDVVQVLPASSPNIAAGTPVTIEGNYFGTNPAPQVFFGGVPATNVQVDWDGQLTADAPADPAGTATDQVVVTVTTSGSSSSTGKPGVNEFTYAPTDAPTITSVAPTSGPEVPSGSVTIEGSNFNDGATPIVDFGTVASIGSMSYSSNEITTTIPGSINIGAVNITVTTPGGTSAISPADLYTYTAAAITSADATTFSAGVSGCIRRRHDRHAGRELHRRYRFRGVHALRAPVRHLVRLHGWRHRDPGGDASRRRGRRIHGMRGGVERERSAGHAGVHADDRRPRPVASASASVVTRLLAGGFGRRHLQLRLGRLPRLDRLHAPAAASGRHHAHR